MADWALVIGINKYDRLRSLDYAERDAALMRDFFQDEARFEQIFYFSDTSPDFYAPNDSPQSTRPTYANLRSFLRDFFEESYLQAGDNFWFFFSGHGSRHQDRDYLMPCDANPRDVEYTAISISYVTERLRRCGADNVVLLLDACRNEGEKAGLGIGGEKQQGVITICSCSPREKSYEIEEIGQGAFTYALLESLRIQGEGNCATVERLYQRLRYRVAEINRDYNKPKQTPYAIAEPASKYHLILLPRQATLQDIAELKIDAFKAEVEGELTQAKQLWQRVLQVSNDDPEAWKHYDRITSTLERRGQPPTSKQTSVTSNTSGAKSRVPTSQKKTVPYPKQSASPEPSLNKQLEDEWIKLSLSQQAVRPFSAITPSTTSWTINRFIGLGIMTTAIAALAGAGIGWRFPEKPAITTQEYTQLRNLLTAKKWKEADQRTGELILKVANREKEGWLDSESIQNFSCLELRTINQLWGQASQGRFSFSVQKRTWESVKGLPLPWRDDYETYKKFGDRVGWYVKDKDRWLLGDDLIYTLNAPPGHLPVSPLEGSLGFMGGVGFSSFTQRLGNCQIKP